jgi:hypothetical protein
VQVHNQIQIQNLKSKMRKENKRKTLTCRMGQHPRNQRTWPIPARAGIPQAAEFSLGDRWDPTVNLFARVCT